MRVKLLSRVRLSVTLWAVVHQAPLSEGFPSQEYWSGLQFPSPGDLPDPGIIKMYEIQKSRKKSKFFIEVTYFPCA